ncbi:N-acetylneuraminate synthase [Clostridium sp. HBUAS56017]|uniref:N-acetylneuraminate synthase n=1 Tax=Clostridium sp. HBUAS56017 TaxID=2571128 RepID=UPI001178787D|nr:N-acetylneuraminate synthase [Clostridium sp. HBUAS56017]
MENEVFIIAEAGVNHNGDVNLAYKLIDAAVDAKVDAIKFQTFKASNIISKFADKAEYQKENTGRDESQLQMVSKLELSFNEFEKLNRYCIKKGIIFLSTPFDEESINFLDSLDMNIFKVPSGEITNIPYLIKIGKLRKKVILSTGMSNIEEIELAVKILKQYGAIDIAILHCNTEYPTPYCDVNLKAMFSIKEKFNTKVGYSDHTLGIEIPIAAVALGAEIIEKHFTLDKKMKGPDHKASLEPNELAKMVKSIRRITEALGTGVKEPSKSEVKNKISARCSIVAKRSIKAGEIFTEDNLTVKRPGNGISPVNWFKVIGNKAVRNFEEDQCIEL